LESRLTAKGCDLAIELEKSFLREILGLGGVSGHA